MSAAEQLENAPLAALAPAPQEEVSGEQAGAAIELQRFANLGRLTIGMAHDLRSALAAAQANLNYLSDQLSLETPANALVEAARDAQTAIDRALTAASNVLALARVRRGPLSSIAAGEEIRQAIAAAEPSVRWQAVRIEFQEAAAPFVLAEPGALMQVLLNLLLNVLDRVGQRGGVVRVSVRMLEDQLGIFIAHQADRTRTLVGLRESHREFAPAGLGYALSSSIIKSFGGDLHGSEGADGTVEFVVALKRAPESTG